MKARELLQGESMVWVSKDALISDAWSLMKQRRLFVLPVLDDAQHLQGMVSLHSLLKHVLPAYIANGSLGDVTFSPDIGDIPEKLKSLMSKSIEEIIEPLPLVVGLDESLLAVVAALMDEHRHHVVFIADERGRLQGVLNLHDIVMHLEAKYNA